MLQKISTDVNKYLILSMLRVKLVSMYAKNNLCDKNDKNAAMIQIHNHSPKKKISFIVILNSQSILQILNNNHLNR